MIACGIHVGTNFLNISWHPEQTLLFCNKSSAKRWLLPLKPSQFGIQTLLTNLLLFVYIRLLDLFFTLFLSFSKKMSIWGPHLTSSGHQHRIQTRPLVPRNFNVPLYGGALLRILVFTKPSYYCAVGTWLFFKGYFSKAIGLCSVLFALLCALFYTSCL